MHDNIRIAIRTLRRNLRLTQEEFAHRLGVAVVTVNRWENGHSMPSKLAYAAVVALKEDRGQPVNTAYRNLEGGACEPRSSD